MKKIKSRIILLIGILLLCICTGFGVIAYTTSADALISNVEQTIPKFAIEASKTIKFGIMNQLNALEVVADDDKIIRFLKNGEKDLTAIKFVMNHEMLRAGHLRMAVVNKNGGAFYNDNYTANLKDMPYFQKAIAGQKTVSDPIKNKEDNTIYMIYAVPIISDSKTVGVLIAYRDGYELSDLAAEITYGQSGKAFMINKQGRTIAHANKEMITTMIQGDSHQQESIDANSSATIAVDGVSAASKESSGNKAIGFENFSSLQNQMIDGQTGFGKYRYEGIEKFIGFAPIEMYGWSVGVEVNKSEVLEGLNSLRQKTVMTSILFLIISLIVAYIIANNIVQPITYLTKECAQMAEGDFSRRYAEKYIKRHDEIGGLAKAFQTIGKNLSGLMKDAAEISLKSASSSQQLNAAIQQYSAVEQEVAKTVEEMARGANVQAEDAEKGFAKVSEMGQLIEQMQKIIVELNDSAHEVEYMKDEGFEILEELVNKTINSSKGTEQIYEVIVSTNESVAKIEKASYMIGNIAEQTNLLALNAAIEAARAGEEGAGFSIVAEEIRKLAEDSNLFTKEIMAVIQELTGKSNGAVDTMKSVSESVESQAESVEMTKVRFKRIAGAIENTKKNIATLNQSEMEMKIKKEEVIDIIQNLSAVSEQNAAGTEEVSASVEEKTESLGQISNTSEMLAELSEKMNRTLDKFKY